MSPFAHLTLAGTRSPRKLSGGKLPNLAELANLPAAGGRPAGSRCTQLRWNL